jgi:DNA polymerase-3 subunit delta
LTNLAENYSVSELADNCLSRNFNKTIKILNENNFSSGDCILIIKTLLLKSKRILQLKKEFEKNNSINQTISSYKPPIFWKDKEIVKNQILNWTLADTEKLIFKINDIELLIKKNSVNSLNILYDFVLSTANQVNN